MTASEEVPLLPPAPAGAGAEAGLGALRTELGNLPLAEVRVRAKVVGLFAHTVLEQTFVNVHGVPLEAVYVFPLPCRAAVTSFRFAVADRIVEGLLKERRDARRDYVDAIAKFQRAALAEEERPGVFTVTVGNLPPGERARVRLTLTGPLSYEDGEATYLFPLVVAPHYVPGAPIEGEPVGEGNAQDTDAVPDASRITPPALLPGFPSPVRLTLEVEVDPAGLPLTGLASSLHAVEVRDAGARRTVSLRPGARLDRDFVLRLRLGAGAVSTSLAVKSDPDGAGGTFLLSVLPPPVRQAERPRDLVIVLDRSGSMSGWKMVAARRAVTRIVGALRPSDRLRLLAFDHEVEAPPGDGGLVHASDAVRFRAVRWLESIEARGGTDLATPLEEATLLLRSDDPGRDRILVLVSDGEVGNEDQSLAAIGRRLRTCRTFAVGIDSAVNEGFLRRLAAAGGGACELVESAERLEVVLGKIHRRIEAPALSSVRLEADGLGLLEATLVPRRLPDVFRGTPFVVSGRFRGAAAGALALVARDATGRSFREVVPALASASDVIPLCWARGEVRELEDRIAVDGDPDGALARAVVAVSLRHGVLSRHTAYVAVDRSDVTPGGEVYRVIQPVELPAGWDAGVLVGAPLAAGATAAMPSSPSFTAAKPLAIRPPLATAASPSCTAGDLRRLGDEQRAPLHRTGGEAGEDDAPTYLLRTPVACPELAETRGPPIDLAAYRLRAAALAARLEEDDPGSLRLALDALIEDLRSVGAPEGESRYLYIAAVLLGRALDAGQVIEESLTSLVKTLVRRFAAKSAAGEGEADG